MIRPGWFWEALVAWMCAVWVAAAIWCFLGYHAKTRREQSHPATDTTTPEEGNR